VDADVLVVDEILGVGDAAFQQRCMRFLRQFRERGTLFFVSHDSGMVERLCDRALWLERGEIRELGPAKEVCGRYRAALLEEPATPAAPPGMPNTVRRQLPPPDLVRDRRWGAANRIELLDFDREAPWFGHGGAVIEEVGFHAPDGERLVAVRGGDEVELRIVCRAERVLTQPIVGFLVRDRLGQNLFGDNTYLAYRAAPPVVEPGATLTSIFRFQFPYLPVGDYALAPSIIEGTQEDHVHLHWIEDALVIRVVASPIRRGLLGVPMKDIRIEPD
jgi:lipopolysaccharide transport system ATP-binding protein